MPVSLFAPAQGKPLVPAQGRAIGTTQGKPFVPAQRRPDAGFVPVSGHKSHFSSTFGFVKIPKQTLFPGASRIFVLASASLIFLVVIFFFGFTRFIDRSLPKVRAYSPPINVADVAFPSDFQRDIFLKNFEFAQKETNFAKRYKILEENYSQILGFYSASHNPSLRLQLATYSKYMLASYPDLSKRRQDAFKVPCFDLSCGRASYPKEISELKLEIDSSSVLTKDVKDNIDKNFESASLSADKGFQWSNYINVLSSLKSSYDKTKNEFVLAAYKKLAIFIEKDYADYKIPPQIRI